MTRTYRSIAPALAPGVLLASIFSGGCIHVGKPNPAIKVTPIQATAELNKMEKAPTPLQRPVVVLNGYHALPFYISTLTANLTRATSGKDDDFLAVSYTLDSTFESMAQNIVEQVDARWPSTDPAQTVEVDVVGASMGGVLARWAALPPEQRVRAGEPVQPATDAPARRLKIARLFTLAAPHRGAAICDLVRPDSAASDIRPGSPFLQTLDQTFPSADYELVCYTQLRDLTVGATRTAPLGREPIWTEGTIFFSHLVALQNPIFQADIARRLRGEEPLAVPDGPPEHD